MGSVDDLFERYKDRGDDGNLYISRNKGYECRLGPRATEATMKSPPAYAM